MCIQHILFIHLSVDGYSGCFHLLAIVNTAALNVWVPAFNFFGYMPRSRIAGSYGNSVFTFFEELVTPS